MGVKLFWGITTSQAPHIYQQCSSSLVCIRFHLMSYNRLQHMKHQSLQFSLFFTTQSFYESNGA